MGGDGHLEPREGRVVEDLPKAVATADGDPPEDGPEDGPEGWADTVPDAASDGVADGAGAAHAASTSRTAATGMASVLDFRAPVIEDLLRDCAPLLASGHGDRMRVRMAPSPTGPLHIGTARTSLYNYLAARHAGGTYVLRIEDTDIARSTPDFERDIIDNLHWLGITWDEGPQVAGGEDIGPMRRTGRASDWTSTRARRSGCWRPARRIGAGARPRSSRRSARAGGRQGAATLQPALPEPDRCGACRLRGRARPWIIRFKVEPVKVRFDDLVRGEVEFDNALLGDFVIVRNDGVPLYHFVVVVDDEAMEITDVIRGEDHLSNTPKHIALIRALGYREPRFGHIPLILNADRSKMSKRKSQTAITAYREEGYLPEAIVNFLAFLGWSPGTEEEIFSLDELAKRFELSKVHKGGAIFDRDRLDHLNGVYIRALTDEQLALRLRPWVPEAIPDDDLLRMVPLVKERLVKLGDVVELLGFVWEPDEVVASWYAPELLYPKKGGPAEARAALEGARAVLAHVDDADFSADLLEQRCREAAEAAGMKAGDFFSPIRVAVTGRTVSPPLFASLELLGRDRSLARIDARARQARPGGRRMTDPPPGSDAPRLDALLDAELLVPIRSSSGEVPDAERLGPEAYRHGTDEAGERFIAAFSDPAALATTGRPAATTSACPRASSSSAPRRPRSASSSTPARRPSSRSRSACCRSSPRASTRTGRMRCAPAARLAACRRSRRPSRSPSRSAASCEPR